MKLSEIEEVGKVVLVKEPAWTIARGYLNQFCNLKAGEPLYTAEQMQEYAKAQVAEALKACLQIKIPGRCDGKSAMIAEQFKNTIDSIFEEDTKND